MVDEMKNLLVSMVGCKVIFGADWALSFSVQPLLFGRADFNTAQLFMADMFFCLRNDDVVGFNQRLALANKMTNLAASYIKVWFRDDFLFDKHDVRKVLYVLARLVGTEALAPSSPVVIAILALEEKYNFQGCFNQDLILWSQAIKEKVKVQSHRSQSITEVQPQPSLQASLESVPSMTTALPQCTDDTTSEPVQSTSNVSPQPSDDISSEPVQSTSNELAKRLWEAIDRRDASGVAEALVAGADPDTWSLSDKKDRWAPLHFCAHDGHLVILRTLLEGGASVNHKTRRMRFTPLHLAAMWGRMDCVRALLQSGADPDIEDISGKTAFNWAKYRKHHAVASFIKSCCIRHRNQQHFPAIQPYYAAAPWFYY